MNNQTAAQTYLSDEIGVVNRVRARAKGSRRSTCDAVAMFGVSVQAGVVLTVCWCLAKTSRSLLGSCEVECYPYTECCG